MNQKSNNSVMVPIAAAIAGAAIGVLLAPRSGRETRSNIKQAVSKYKRKAGEGVEQVKQATSKAIGKAQDMTEEASNRIKNEAKQVNRSAKGQVAGWGKE
jgi:gas vesicle protein